MLLNKPQYPDTNSPVCSPYIFLKNELREFDKRSKHFPFGDHFIDSHDLFYLLCIDIVGRKLMLVTLWTWTLYAIPGKIYDFDTEFHSLCELSPDQLLGPLKVL